MTKAAQSSPTQCPVCSFTRLREKPFGYRFNGRWLGGYGCPVCGIIFLHPQPTPDELAKMYSKEYFEGDFRCGHAGSYYDEATQRSLADQNLITTIQQYKAGGKFLEIGCAGGAFLNAARKAGYDVQGIEFSHDAAALAREKYGLNVITGDVLDGMFRGDTFDVVFMGDVLEHLPDPLATCREIHRIMAPDGVLVIECPMQTNTLFSRIGFAAYGLLGWKATVNMPPYHLFEFRSPSMRALLGRAGFEIAATREGILPPGEIALRGTGLQNLAKKIFQYPNAVVTRLFGVLGDRIEMIAHKPNRPNA